MPDVILVLNLGLKSVRCIAFNFSGGVLAQSAKPIRTFVNNNRVEQDPRDWEKLSWEVIRDVTDDVGSSVLYLTVTTSASCLVAVDKEGKPLHNSILVSDTRAVQEANTLSCNDEFRAVQNRTGGKSSPDLMLPKIMWLARHEPETFQQAAHFVNVGDYLVARLCGRYVTDPHNAEKFHYEIQERCYPEALLASIEIDSSKLPEVVEVGADLGPVVPALADELGVPRSCRVVLSTYDALAAVAGAGAFDEGAGTDVSGTVTSFRAVTNHHLVDPLRRIYVTPHFYKDRWLAGGSTNLGGGVIEWLRQLLFSDAADPYADMEKQASGAQVCPGGLIFLPHLLGERAPLWNPNCRGVLFGLNRAHGKGDITRAVFEGIGFSVRHIFDTLRELSVPIQSVTVSGGLTRLNTINQLKADILGVPVRKLDNFESTSIGAALISLNGAGVFNHLADGFDLFCRIEQVFEPEMSKHAIYDEYFGLYLQVYEALGAAYESRAKLLASLQKQGVDELALTENL